MKSVLLSGLNLEKSSSQGQLQKKGTEGRKSTALVVNDWHPTLSASFYWEIDPGLRQPDRKKLPWYTSFPDYKSKNIQITKIHKM